MMRRGEYLHRGRKTARFPVQYPCTISALQHEVDRCGCSHLPRHSKISEISRFCRVRESVSRFFKIEYIAASVRLQAATRFRNLSSGCATFQCRYTSAESGCVASGCADGGCRKPDQSKSQIQTLEQVWITTSLEPHSRRQATSIPAIVRGPK